MLKGSFLVTRALLPMMRTARYGRIINIGSIHSLVASPFKSAYVAAKHGLIGFSKSIAREFASRGVTVNALAPGFIETDMTAVLNEQTKTAILNNIPMKALGKVDDIAGAALFLASPAARYITGQVLAVDGGMVMA